MARCLCKILEAHGSKLQKSKTTRIAMAVKLHLKKEEKKYSVTSFKTAKHRKTCLQRNLGQMETRL
jgi:hypothetical protein